ncbi:MAG TPA: HK97 family phage prohead protease, partial [Thermomicrobiaceae bacterium]|nr:HK97 family phage prohead protease [Thermomicrobiaceae bacterium]
MDALDQPIGDLRRAMPGNYEVKDPDTGPPRLVGHFTEWDTWTEIESLVEGHFFEQTPRAALTKTLQENRDRMRCLFQHGEDPQIGKKVIGPIEVLEADDVGPYYEVPLFKSVPDLVIDGLRAGQYGSSYTFRPTKRPTVVQRPSRSAFNPDGLPQRTLTEVRVIEFGPCVFNFYQGATASARSATDEAIVRRLLDDPERFQEIAKRAGISVPQLPYTDSAPAPGTTLYSVQLQAGVMPAEHRRAERLYKRAAEYAFETPWAVTPRILAVIQTILRERLSGLRPSAEEIQERISSGTSTISSDAAPAADGPVAVINVAGTIMPHAASFSNVSQSGTSIEDLQQQFRDAMASEDVKAILFNIDSPGGSAALVPEFGSEIRDARGTKPIIAVANTMAASAAYWIA